MPLRSCFWVFSNENFQQRILDVNKASMEVMRPGSGLDHATEWRVNSRLAVFLYYRKFWTALQIGCDQRKKACRPWFRHLPSWCFRHYGVWVPSVH